MSEKQKPEKAPEKLEDFAPIVQLHLRDTGIKSPYMTSTIDLFDGTTATTTRTGGTRQIAQALEWHPAGVRVFFATGAVFVVPFDQIDTIVQRAFPKRK